MLLCVVVAFRPLRRCVRKHAKPTKGRGGANQVLRFIHLGDGDDNQPPEGEEIINSRLAFSLRFRSEVRYAELQHYGVGALHEGMYILSGTSYYKPAGAYEPAPTSTTDRVLPSAGKLSAADEAEEEEGDQDGARDDEPRDEEEGSGAPTAPASADAPLTASGQLRAGTIKLDPLPFTPRTMANTTTALPAIGNAPPGIVPWSSSAFRARIDARRGGGAVPPTQCAEE